MVVSLKEHFDQYLRKHKIKHLWTYPQCPKINSCIERYNKSVQEEWMNSYLDEIEDIKQFNKRLQEYIYFYNNKRVHESLGLKTPAQVVGKELISPICVWTCTFACFFSKIAANKFNNVPV